CANRLSYPQALDTSASTNKSVCFPLFHLHADSERNLPSFETSLVYCLERALHLANAQIALKVGQGEEDQDAENQQRD
ncbi:MAG: hypothetical protein WCC08_21900, partial [Terrimicrobiaceae bacterium]